MALSTDTIVRAWRDSDFRETLSAEDRAALPDAPGDLDTLSDEQLADVAGGNVLDGTAIVEPAVAGPSLLSSLPSSDFFK